MAKVYRPRHPELTLLYRVLFHYFDQFIAEYESRFEREYGSLRSIVKEVTYTIGNHPIGLLAPGILKNKGLSIDIFPRHELK